MPHCHAVVHSVESLEPFITCISWLNAKSRSTKMVSNDWVCSGLMTTGGHFQCIQEIVCWKEEQKDVSAFKVFLLGEPQCSRGDFMVLMGKNTMIKRSIRLLAQKTRGILGHAVHGIYSHDASGHTLFNFSNLQMASVDCHRHHLRYQRCFPLFGFVVPLISEGHSFKVVRLQVSFRKRKLEMKVFFFKKKIHRRRSQTLLWRILWGHVHKVPES